MPGSLARGCGIRRLVPAVVSGLSHGERGESVAGEVLAVGGQGDGPVGAGAQERGAGGVFELADLAGEDGVPDAEMAGAAAGRTVRVARSSGWTAAG
jgi:hypothetical protein